ncbi:unnamed protein product [Phytophthora lilii]|uniref:Unnamed protein product n=1 Tax=Phytophthora lilii TaxID=2077276 RepID=A0A9W6TDR3_9STRA|nr:unnamed protein product [Phytophthora lilii]
MARLTLAEEAEARRREEKALEAADGETREDAEAETEVEQMRQVALTPPLLALAFQRLVAQDKREFLAHQQVAATDGEGEGAANVQHLRSGDGTEDDEKTSEPPARVYLLVDYPSSLPEIDALLRLGEAGCPSKVMDGPGSLPLLPLIDGVLLIADPLGVSAARGRNRSGSTNLPRRSVVKVEGAGPRMSMMETSVFQASNAVVRAFYEAAQVGGIEWSDFTFTNIGCNTEASGLKQPEELENEVIDTLEGHASQKFEFKKWVASTTFCAIPSSTVGVDSASDALCKKYESILSDVFPGSITVSTVLFSVTEAVSMASSPSTISSTWSTSAENSHNNRNLSSSEEFIEYGDLVACRNAHAQLCQEVLNAEGNPCFLFRGDYRLDDVERAMWRQSDLPGVGNEGRKAMPRVPELSRPERSVRDTELATFYESPRLNCLMVHLTRQLLQVENMLGESWRGKLQPRSVLEKLSRAILPQRVALVLQQNTPDTYSSYYAPTDSLLLACLPKTAPGRMQSSSWTARDHVRHRPAFKDWRREELVSQEYLTPRTEAAAGSCVPLSAGQLAQVATQTWSMESFGLRSEESVVADNDHEGQSQGRSAPESGGCMAQFIASFQNESTLHISEGKRKLPKKPDKFPTITVTNSFPNGLIVSTCSDGSIVQRYAQTTRKNPNNSVHSNRSDNRAGNEAKHTVKASQGPQSDSEGEQYRVIYGKGSVLRVLQCGRKEVMLASGVVRVLYDCSKHRHSSRKQTSSSEKQPPLVTTLTVDPETNALVERRPNGSIIVTLTSGARVTYHVDGTRMYMNSGSTHVLVKKRGFADVCIDVEVNVTAQHHAAGERVAVTKGGLRMRSVVNIYDGTCVEISYNTKVTAQVNGRVTTRKPGGQVIVAKDSGRVEYASQHPGSAFAQGSDSKDDDDRDVTSHNGVYYFDCRRGSFQLCDNEQNQFHVSFSGTDEEVGPTISVDLAGVVSDTEAARYEVDSIPAKAVINEPIQPHIFVLNGDGTGMEILRPQDIAEYIEEAVSESQEGGRTGTALSLTEQQHTILRRLSAPGDATRHSQPLFNDEKLQAEMLQLQRPVATAGKYLPSYFAEAEHASAKLQFTTVRRVQQIRPLSPGELDEMRAGWAKWEQWQREREANKECYNVADPRQPDVIAQELAMQKKVLGAYKATRARKKMARQKAREMKAKSASQELSPGLRMETVQEGEETLAGEGEDEDDSDDEFGQFGSDMSDDDVGETVEVDDPMELLWSAFSQADSEGRGLLSVAQTSHFASDMTGPPSPKRQRTDDNKPEDKELEKVQKVLESVQKVEEELEKENVLQAKEILVIETKYNAKKRPAYVKRNKLLAEIPHFWKQVTFKENDYFSPTTLWKQVKFSEDEEEVEVTASEISWKEKAEMTEESEKFPFFQEEEEEGDEEEGEGDEEAEGEGEDKE